MPVSVIKFFLSAAITTNCNPTKNSKTPNSRTQKWSKNKLAVSSTIPS